MPSLCSPDANSPDPEDTSPDPISVHVLKQMADPEPPLPNSGPAATKKKRSTKKKSVTKANKILHAVRVSFIKTVHQ
jgi:hypothetical protein